jgi:hypothetical protein
VDVGLAGRLLRCRPPTPRLDARDWDGEVGLRRDHDGEIENACLLHAQQDLAFDEKDGRARPVLDAELGNSAGITRFRNGDQTHVVGLLVEEVMGRVRRFRSRLGDQRYKGEPAGCRRSANFEGLDEVFQGLRFAHDGHVSVLGRQLVVAFANAVNESVKQ